MSRWGRSTPSHWQIQKYETGTNRIALSTLMTIAAAIGTTAFLSVAEFDTS